MTPETLRLAGLEALRRELGATGMVRFLQQYESGQGDYTAERWNWLEPGIEAKALAAVIRSTRSSAEA